MLLLLLVVVELKFRNESVLLFQKMLWCTAYEILFAFKKMKLIWKHMFAQIFEISFRKIIFLFGFHWLSNGSSKIILVFQVIKNILPNWYFEMNKKNQIIFDIVNWLLKVRFRHFSLTHWKSVNVKSKEYFSKTDFWEKTTPSWPLLTTQQILKLNYCS